MSADTFSVRKFLVTISQTAYLEQAPMTLHFIDIFSSYWRYSSHAIQEVSLIEELHILILLREVFISISFFHLLDTDLSHIPENCTILRNTVFSQIWEHLEQISDDCFHCRSIRFCWNQHRETLELEGTLSDGSLSTLYIFTL